MREQHRNRPAKRRYPPFYEKAVPVILAIIVVFIVVLIGIAISVALGLYPSIT